MSSLQLFLYSLRQRESDVEVRGFVLCEVFTNFLKDLDISVSTALGAEALYDPDFSHDLATSLPLADRLISVNLSGMVFATLVFFILKRF